MFTRREIWGKKKQLNNDYNILKSLNHKIIAGTNTKNQLNKVM